MTVSELLRCGEDDDCIDSLSPEDKGLSLPRDISNSIEGNEDSADEEDQKDPDISTKELAVQRSGDACTVSHNGFRKQPKRGKGNGTRVISREATRRRATSLGRAGEK